MDSAKEWIDLIWSLVPVYLPAGLVFFNLILLILIWRLYNKVQVLTSSNKNLSKRFTRWSRVISDIEKMVEDISKRL